MSKDGRKSGKPGEKDWMEGYVERRKSSMPPIRSSRRFTGQGQRRGSTDSQGPRLGSVGGQGRRGSMDEPKAAQPPPRNSAAENTGSADTVSGYRGSASLGSSVGSLDSEPENKYPVEGPHKKKEQPPETFGSVQPDLPTSIIMEEESVPGCGGMTLQGLVLAIAIAEIFVGMINLILFAMRLHIHFASKHEQTVVKNLHLANQLLFFTKNEFSFLFETYSEDHFDAMIEGTLALEAVRFAMGVFLLFGGIFPDLMGLLTWGWLTVTPVRLIVSLIICPDALWVIIAEVLAIWIVFSFQHSNENPETRKSTVYKTSPESWIALEREAGMKPAGHVV